MTVINTINISKLLIKFWTSMVISYKLTAYQRVDRLVTFLETRPHEWNSLRQALCHCFTTNTTETTQTNFKVL